MATIYQLMIDDKQIGELYYNEGDVINDATQLSIEREEHVEVWGAEEIEDIPVDCLEWTKVWVIWLKYLRQMEMTTSHYNVPGREKQPIEIMRDGMTDEDLKNVVIGGL